MKRVYILFYNGFPIGACSTESKALLAQKVYRFQLQTENVIFQELDLDPLTEQEIQEYFNNKINIYDKDLDN
jgi:hypothetical protein